MSRLFEIKLNATIKMCFLLVAFFLMNKPAFAGKTISKAKVIKCIKCKNEYKGYSGVSEISQDFIESIAIMLNEKKFLIANSSEEFNQSDVVEPLKPSRRFVLGGECSRYSFLVYDQGGYSVDTRLLVYEKASKQIVFGTIFNSKIRSNLELIGSLKNNAFTKWKVESPN